MGIRETCEESDFVQSHFSIVEHNTKVYFLKMRGSKAYTTVRGAFAVAVRYISIFVLHSPSSLFIINHIHNRFFYFNATSSAPSIQIYFVLSFFYSCRPFFCCCIFSFFVLPRIPRPSFVKINNDWLFIEDLLLSLLTVPH